MSKENSNSIFPRIGGSVTFGSQSYNQTALIGGAILAVLAGIVGYFWGKKK